MAWNLFEFEEELKPKPKPEVKLTDIDFKKYVYESKVFKDYDSVLVNMLMSCYTNDFLELPKEKYPSEIQAIKEIIKTYHEVFKSDKLTIATYYKNERYTMIYKPKGDYIVETHFKNFEDEICFPACAIWWYDEQGNPVESNEYMMLKSKEELDYMHQLLDEAYKKYGNKYNIEFRDRRDYYFHKVLGFENWSKPRFTDSPSKNWFSFCNRVGNYLDMIAYFQKRDKINQRVTVTYQFDHTATSDEVIEKMRDVEKMRKQLMPDSYIYKGFEINKNGSKYDLVLIYVDKKYKVDVEE
jgi:hypothetical protein